MVGIEGGDGEVAVGVGDAQQRGARPQLDERGAVELGEDAEGDEDGEAGGVDRGGGGDSGGGSDVGEGSRWAWVRKRWRFSDDAEVHVSTAKGSPRGISIGIASPPSALSPRVYRLAPAPASPKSAGFWSGGGSRVEGQ